LCSILLAQFFYGYFVYNAKMIKLSREFFGGFHNFFYGKIKKNNSYGILIFLQIHVPGYMVDEKKKKNWIFFGFFPLNQGILRENLVEK
jgi:hypothetical protein